MTYDVIDSRGNLIGTGLALWEARTLAVGDREIIAVGEDGTVYAT